LQWTNIHLSTGVLQVIITVDRYKLLRTDDDQQEGVISAFTYGPQERIKKKQYIIEYVIQHLSL